MLNEELLQSSAGVFYLALQATLPFQRDTCFLPKRPSKTRSRALLLVRCTERGLVKQLTLMSTLKDKERNSDLN